MRCPWSAVHGAGEGALLLEFGSSLDPKLTQAIHATAHAVRKAAINGVWGVVPAYTTLLVEFDPLVATSQAVLDSLRGIEVTIHEESCQYFVIPSLYGGEYGVDLEDVARAIGLAPKDVVAMHTAGRYQIYCIGFSPGFPLCGVLPERIRIPRHSSPRTVVPAGSVAIAGAQTGIYPTASPGGWNLLGRTPAELFHLDRDPPVVYHPGDFVQFRSIERSEYDELAHAVREGIDVIGVASHAAD